MYRQIRSKFYFGCASVFSILSISTAHAAIELAKGENSSVSFFGTGQILGEGEWVNDNVKKNARLYLFMQQARLGFSGHVEDYNFYTELALGGENMTPGSANPAFTLLEMRFDIPTWKQAYLRVGQFKTPSGAEFLTPDSQRLFTENSIASYGANWGREMGLALVSKSDSINGAIGLFTGGGEDTSVLPIHALPEDFGTPLIMARFGFDDTGAGALGHTQAQVFKVDGTQKALYLQGAYEIDSLIGHSSAMNVKAGQSGMVYQQNLLLNSAWNPYLATTDKATLYSLGINGLLRTTMNETVLTAEFEANLAGFIDTLGSLRMYSARLQGSAAKKPWEFAFRLASLVPDSNMASGAIGNAPFYEFTPSVSYYLKDWSKLIFEVQAMVNVPVAHEPGNGAYVLSEMPSQTTYSATVGGKSVTLPSSITRDFVPEVKLMWQITL